MADADKSGGVPRRFFPGDSGRRVFPNAGATENAYHYNLEDHISDPAPEPAPETVPAVISPPTGRGEAPKTEPISTVRTVQENQSHPQAPVKPADSTADTEKIVAVHLDETAQMTDTVPLETVARTDAGTSVPNPKEVVSMPPITQEDINLAIGAIAEQVDVDDQDDEGSWRIHEAWRDLIDTKKKEIQALIQKIGKSGLITRIRERFSRKRKDSGSEVNPEELKSGQRERERTEYLEKRDSLRNAIEVQYRELASNTTALQTANVEHTATLTAITRATEQSAQIQGEIATKTSEAVLWVNSLQEFPGVVGEEFFILFADIKSGTLDFTKTIPYLEALLARAESQKSGLQAWLPKEINFLGIKRLAGEALEARISPILKLVKSLEEKQKNEKELKTKIDTLKSQEEYQQHRISELGDTAERIKTNIELLQTEITKLDSTQRNDETIQEKAREIHHVAGREPNAAEIALLDQAVTDSGFQRNGDQLVLPADGAMVEVRYTGGASGWFVADEIRHVPGRQIVITHSKGKGGEERVMFKPTDLEEITIRPLIPRPVTTN